MAKKFRRDRFSWGPGDVQPSRRFKVKKSSLTFACYSAACAPPPEGVGGSKPGGGKSVAVKGGYTYVDGKKIGSKITKMSKGEHKGLWKATYKGETFTGKTRKEVADKMSGGNAKVKAVSKLNGGTGPKPKKKVAKEEAPEEQGTTGRRKPPKRKRSDADVFNEHDHNFDRPAGFNTGPPPVGVPLSGLFTDSEVAALAEYRGDFYPMINKTLRGQKRPRGEMSKKINDTIVEMDSAFENASRTTGDLMVYRGIRQTGFLGDSRSFTDRSYVSTSLDRDVAEGDFTMDQGRAANLMKIRIPAGSRVIRMSGNNHENELLLPRGSEFRLVNKRTNTWELVVDD